MKNKIREELIKKRDKLGVYEVFKKSNDIISKLVSLQEFKKAKKLLCYISFDNEVYTHGLIKKYVKEKDIAVPVVRGNELILSYIKEWGELTTGAYGILEPKEIRKANLNDIEIAIIPGIAFDNRGYRIGYGKGYFDRLLSKMNALKIALAFDFQILDEVPEEKHDVRMDMIITEKRILQLNHTFYK